MRNNEERFGSPAAQGAEAPPVPVETGTPPVDLPEAAAAEEKHGQPTVLNFSIPTEIVDLPSKGRFYKPDHPLHQCETIEIRFMTAKDEDILTSKSLLRKGLAVDRLLSSVILDKRIKPDDLLVGDKNQWGKGYATEAIKSITNFAFDKLGLHKLTAGCYADNIGSIKSFKKVGFFNEGNWKDHYNSNGEYVDRVCLAILES